MQSIDITLYTIPNCPHCDNVRRLLSERGLFYTDHDVSSNYSALRRMFKLSKQKLVPVVEAGGKAVVRPCAEDLDLLLSHAQKER